MTSNQLETWRSNMGRIRDLALQSLAVCRPIGVRASDLLTEVFDIAVATGLQMEQAGASQSPGSREGEGPAIQVDLLESSKNRELLEAIEHTVRLAYAVNAERGFASSGTSQILEVVRETVWTECNGPRRS